MVCLPVSLPTNSSTTTRRSSSRSPVFRSIRISTIMGIMISIQPDRITEIVPSKSKSATRALAAEAPGRRCSIIQFILPCAFPDQPAFRARSTHAIHRAQDQMAPGEFIQPALLRSDPVREKARLHMMDYDVILLIHRIRAVVGSISVVCCALLLAGTQTADG